MSKKEMIRLKNKYKLWVALHPPDESLGCKECRHKLRNCSFQRTLLYINDTDKVMFSKKCQDAERICIEWIKDV